MWLTRPSSAYKTGVNLNWICHSFVPRLFTRKYVYVYVIICISRKIRNQHKSETFQCDVSNTCFIRVNEQAMSQGRVSFPASDNKGPLISLGSVNKSSFALMYLTIEFTRKLEREKIYISMCIKKRFCGVNE